MRIYFRATERGFTLIELLVVMMILGVTAALVVLSVPRGPDPVEELTEQLADTVSGLSEAAVTSGRAFGLVLGEERLEAYAWSDGAWRPRNLNLPQVPSGYTIRLEPGAGFVFPPEPERYDKVFRDEPAYGAPVEDDAPRAPNILFSPTGDRTPFVLSIVGQGEIVTIEAGARSRPEIRYE